VAPNSLEHLGLISYGKILEVSAELLIGTVKRSSQAYHVAEINGALWRKWYSKEKVKNLQNLSLPLSALESFDHSG
jgi:hypothetical protein